MHKALEQLERRLTACLRHLDANETQLHLPEKWTIQQIAQHLILTYASTSNLFKERIAKDRPTRSSPSLLQRCGQFGVLRLGYFPEGLKAPLAVIPGADQVALSGAELARSAQEQLAGTALLLEQMEKSFGEQKRSASHVRLGPLRPSDWSRFHLVHGTHHIRQIESTLRAADSTLHRPAASLLHR